MLGTKVEQQSHPGIESATSGQNLYDFGIRLDNVEHVGGFLMQIRPSRLDLSVVLGWLKGTN
jgi:hypothetical protein